MKQDIVYYATLLSHLDKYSDVYALCDALQNVMLENHCSLSDAYDIIKDELTNL